MSEEGEFLDRINLSEDDLTMSSNVFSMTGTKPGHEYQKSHKAKVKKSKYDQLEAKFDRLESLVTRVLGNMDSPPPAQAVQRPETETNSELVHNDNEVLSIFADDCSFLEDNLSDCNNNNPQLSDMTKQCLFDMFGEDALVKNKPVKEGISLDDSQLKVLQNSFRCDKPNFLTAFNEESVDMFPVDESCEKYLKVPSLDDLVDGCLTKRYGQKASFSKNKGKVLFTQPCKMVDKICFKGQHAARMGLVMQCYLQQGLGSLLTAIQADDLDKVSTVQKVKDVFAISTKVLDQLGRAGAFHHIARRAVAMTDTGLFEQHDSMEFTNLPLSGEGLFGPELELLLKARKEKKKQVDDLIPDVRRPKRKPQSDYDLNKRTRFESYGKPASSTAAQGSSTSWNNFRIPKVQNKGRYDDRFSSKPRGSGGGFPRRQEQSFGRGKADKPADK